jgi:probable phosphoglycerate mutase
LGLQVSEDACLIECDFGDWTGAALAELARLPQWREVQQSPSTFRFHGGESSTEMQARMVGAPEVLRAAHPGGVVVCFSQADPAACCTDGNSTSDPLSGLRTP